MRIAQVSKTSETTPALAPYLITLAQYNSLCSIDGGDSMFTMFTPYDHIWCYNIRTYRGWIEKRSNCRALL